MSREIGPPKWTARLGEFNPKLTGGCTALVTTTLLYANSLRTR